MAVDQTAEKGGDLHASWTVVTCGEGVGETSGLLKRLAIAKLDAVAKCLPARPVGGCRTSHRVGDLLEK